MGTPQVVLGSAAAVGLLVTGLAGWLTGAVHSKDEKRALTAVVRASGKTLQPVVTVTRVEEAVRLVTVASGARYEVVALNMCEETLPCFLLDVWCFDVNDVFVD
jgi:hypothetical protein